jgi:putative hydrolase of HD superfamily
MSPLLTGILDFTRMTHALREVRRSCLYSDNLVGENDLEHGYQLALLCRYIYDTMHLSLDLSRILRYALTHDIVEVYAGDTLPFDSL